MPERLCSRCRERPATSGGYCAACHLEYRRERRASYRKRMADLEERSKKLAERVRELEARIYKEEQS